ncbi:MAG: bifunctional chorismate mutase/prephenate dehydratase [Eubacteriales bacterium]
MNLDTLREKINSLDEEIVRLYVERMKVAGEVADYKLRHGLPVFQQGREEEVLKRVSGMAGADYGDGVRLLYMAMMDVSKSYQHMTGKTPSPLRDKLNLAISRPFEIDRPGIAVACQGVPGAYSDIACSVAFSSPSKQYYSTFEDIFEAVRRGEAVYGILPIENSTAGSVLQVYDLMKKYSFYIHQSVKLSVEHCLLVKSGTRLEDIKEIYTHEQALGQCSEFLSAHPEITANVYSNTAAAAKLVSESERGDIAAIASFDCARLYNLEVLHKGLQNKQANFTRFICFSTALNVPTGASKISISLKVPHTTGSLYRILSRFAVCALNLSKIESRPIPGMDFEFMFYFDFEGSVRDNHVVDLLCGLERELDYFEFLGNYIEK